MATVSERDQNELVRLAAAGNSILAHIWQNALEEEGIFCQVLGDFLDAGIGDIPGLSVELWVKPEDLPRAAAILQEHQNSLEAAEETPEPKESTCSLKEAEEALGAEENL